MGLFENIKNNLKETSDGEIEKLKIELRSRIEDLSNDDEIPKLTDDDINNIANKIKGEGFFISNNIFADDDDEYEWEQINMYLDNKIRDYVEQNYTLKEAYEDYGNKGKYAEKNFQAKANPNETRDLKRKLAKDFKVGTRVSLKGEGNGEVMLYDKNGGEFGSVKVQLDSGELVSVNLGIDDISVIKESYNESSKETYQEENHNLSDFNNILGDWDFIGDVTNPYISYVDINGDTINISIELWDPDLDDYVSIDGGTIKSKELVDKILNTDFYSDGSSEAYEKAGDLLHKLYPDNWQDLCDQLYSELHKQLRAEGYEDENGNRINESQTQEIDAVLKALKEKNPNIEKYLNEYYKAIADTEPRPAYDKEKDRMDPAWENWNKTTNNVLYSREAWENFTNWVKEKYGENLNETEELKEGSDYWNDKFGQEALDEYKNNQDKDGIPKGKTPFKVGDPVYYSYLSDNNKHNGVVGNIEWLRKYQYYPFGHKGDSDTVIYKWQGSIKYPDGSTESIGDAYAKGGGVTSPLRIAPKEFKPGDKIPWDYKIDEAEDKKGPTLEEDEYNAVDYFLTDSKMYDSGFYLKQDKNMKDYFVDAGDNNKKYSLKNGLHVIYEAMVPEYVAEYPKDIQKGLEKVMRKYLGDKVGDEIKSWCSKPKKEAESIKTVGGLEDGKSYWAYVSKHGLGPGTIPNDVEAALVTDLPETGKTLFCVDRQLTPEELDKYELALFDNSYFNKYPEVVKELMALK